MNAEIWNERYGSDPYIYGTDPNAFLREQSDRLPPQADVVELGAGEGLNAVWLAEQGHRVTVLDYASAGLQKALRLAERRGVSVTAEQADVTLWQPGRAWDVVVVTFFHLHEAHRPALYRLIQRILSPGGLLIAEWFRPEQVTGGYPGGGPPAADLMISANELSAHFATSGTLLLAEAETELSEGTHHWGPAVVVRLVWRKPPSSGEYVR